MVSGSPSADGHEQVHSGSTHPSTGPEPWKITGRVSSLAPNDRSRGSFRNGERGRPGTPGLPVIVSEIELESELDLPWVVSKVAKRSDLTEGCRVGEVQERGIRKPGRIREVE